MSKSMVKVKNRTALTKCDVEFAVGNTYYRIPDSEAKYSRNGRHKKVHDWTVYVDVVRGSSDLVESVDFQLSQYFQPRVFTCRSPIRITLPTGQQVLRFRTRQQSTRAVTANITIHGRGGATLHTSHTTQLSKNGSRQQPAVFEDDESCLEKTLPKVPIPSDTTFGIELEMSTSRNATSEMVHEAIGSQTGWHIKHDGSIVCNLDNPSCFKFELVSPILKGEAGLRECERVIKAVNIDSNSFLVVNKSMGFHVHVGVEPDLSVLKKICQNFIKYEDAMDSFMPPSRRTGSQQSNSYCRSNKHAFVLRTNSSRHNAISSCTSLEQLCRLMNPTGRYYKLNLQNLVTGRQPTIEFRQHSATANYAKVEAWVRFCVLFVTNSKKLREPNNFKDNRDVNHQFDKLFEYVIKDRALREIFVERRSDISREHHHSKGSCCDGCRTGGECNQSNFFLPTGK